VIALAKVNASLPISGKGSSQSLNEPRLELTNCLVSSAKLRMDRGPGNRRWLPDLGFCCNV
jgi:hypothetical protein